jgi:CspA family cold shock protein
MRSGTLKWFDAKKQFGFIAPTDGGEDVLVRQSSFDAAGMAPVEVGATLQFNIHRADDGLHAVDLQAG